MQTKGITLCWHIVEQMPTGKVYREVRNQYSQSVRKAKASFFKQKFASCSSNSKKLWDTVKSMENKSTSSQLPTALRLDCHHR